MFGVTEPAIYGITLPRVKQFVVTCIGGDLGGAYLGLTKVVTNAFVFGSVTTFPAFVTDKSSNFIQAMIGLGISLVVSAILDYMFTDREEALS